jgi:DNA-binding transcriptional MerR regulator
MTIGEFAQASGLSIPALRFYDEKGLLEPYDVDPATEYRRYVAAQVRRAAVIKVLRQIGLSLTQVAQAVNNPDRIQEVVAQFTRDLATERARQDAAISYAPRSCRPTRSPPRSATAAPLRRPGWVRWCRWISSRRSSRTPRPAT